MLYVLELMAREYLHDLADRPRSASLIGKQLASIAISPDMSERWAVVYHSDVVDPEAVMPADVILLPWLAQQYATLMPAAAGVVKALEHAADMCVTFHVATVGRKRDFGTGREKLLNLFNRAQLGLIHVDHHFWMIIPLTNSPQITVSGSFLVGNTGCFSGSYLIGQGCW